VVDAFTRTFSSLVRIKNVACLKRKELVYNGQRAKFETALVTVMGKGSFNCLKTHVSQIGIALKRSNAKKHAFIDGALNFTVMC
jgi:hypothetical protein